MAKTFTKEALELAQKATQVYPQMMEAFYNHAKFSALLGDGQTAINSLKTAILADRNYCLKVDADKDFNSVRGYVSDLFKSLYNQAKTEVEKALTSVKSLLNDYVYQGTWAKNAETEAKALMQQAQSLYDADKYFDFLDALSILKKAQETIDSIISIYRKGIISRQEFKEQQRQEKEQEEWEEQKYRLKNKLCLECGAKLRFMERFRGEKNCKLHRPKL